jgi:rhodanese-related sulfurtransferase
MQEHGRMGMPFTVPPTDVFLQLGTAWQPAVIDVRRPAVAAESGRLLPGSRLATDGDWARLAAALDRARPVIVACAHGHNRSQRLAAHLRAEGFDAATVADGFDGWLAAGLPTVPMTVGPFAFGDKPSVWVTRRRPKIDRIACPWLVRRFIDPQARFLFVDPDQVLAVAEEEGGIAYDLPGAPFEHEGPLCTFDILLREFGLGEDSALGALAGIVRGADTDRLDLAPQAAGLLAVSLGHSALAGEDDHAMLARMLPVYDGLLAWARHAQGERHSWPRPAGAGAAA